MNRLSNRASERCRTTALQLHPLLAGTASSLERQEAAGRRLVLPATRLRDGVGFCGDRAQALWSSPRCERGVGPPLAADARASTRVWVASVG